MTKLDWYESVVFIKTEYTATNFRASVSCFDRMIPSFDLCKKTPRWANSDVLQLLQLCIDLSRGCQIRNQMSF